MWQLPATGFYEPASLAILLRPHLDPRAFLSERGSVWSCGYAESVKVKFIILQSDNVRLMLGSIVILYDGFLDLLLRFVSR